MGAARDHQAARRRVWLLRHRHALQADHPVGIGHKTLDAAIKRPDPDLMV